MSENLLKNKSLWYGVGAGMGIMALAGVFVLGVAYGPDIRAKLTGNQINTSVSTIAQAANVTTGDPDVAKLAEAVLPSAGITLPVKWGDLGKQLIEKGVIDRDQFVALYQDRLGLGPNEIKMLDDNNNGNIVITSDNAGVILNLLWALGLGNKNPILDTGPMVSEQYGGAGNFASTGGWSLSKGNAMQHYSKYNLIKLTKDQQTLVERVSQNIFRPCCNNSTYFPDCNHGMAMLALLEMMASQGVSESDMYKVALQVNAYWFPDTYLTLAKYEAKNGVAWENVDAQKMLSAEYSSASGYKAIRAQIQPVKQGGGGGCGV
jgi:hypothetical protein